MQTVGDVMTKDVLTVPKTATLGQVARSMRARNVGSAIVVDERGGVAGIISERELVESVARSRNPDVGTAESCMNQEVRTISPATGIAEAVEAMRLAGVRHLPVVDDGTLSGIVSMRDLLASVV
jgi:CBS domain-containing protein